MSAPREQDEARHQARHEVAAEDEGARLDRYCAARHPELSRTFLSALIREGAVLVDGSPARPSTRLEAGSEVTLSIPPREESRLRPEALPLRVVHEDEAIFVVDKDADVVMHPGAGVREGTLAAALLHRDPALGGVGGEGRPGIVHRLDRGTTGLVVVARTPAAYGALRAAFEARTVDKDYLAIVWGRPREREGAIARPIGRDPRARHRMAVDVKDARPALSTWHVLGEVPGFALVRARIETGRTHQVRVHLAAIGHPLVGDATYGGARWRGVQDPARRALLKRFDRPALHAWRLAFAHPTSGERVRFEAPIPDDLGALWSGLGGRLP